MTLFWQRGPQIFPKSYWQHKVNASTFYYSIKEKYFYEQKTYNVIYTNLSRDDGFTRRKPSFSFNFPVVEENKQGYLGLNEASKKAKCIYFHCIKSVRIWSFSGPYFPAFGLNTEIYKVNLRTQLECEKTRTRKTRNMDTFYAVFSMKLILIMLSFIFFIWKRRDKSKHCEI